MAVRAIGTVDQFRNDSEDGTVQAVGTLVVVGDDFGSMGSATYNFTVTNLDPDSLTILQDVAAVLKAQLIAEGVPFGLLNIDTVRIM